MNANRHTPCSSSFASTLRSASLALAAVLLLGVGLLSAGCGGSAGNETAEGETQDIHLVYVNWVEGVAMAHVMDALLADSLGMNVERTEVSGAGTAFSSVASGDADVFTEVWLPTTHASGWERYGDQLTRIGQWYDSTSVGLVTPTYTGIESVADLDEYRQELGGEINGIESGAQVNEQARQILEENGIEGFSVVNASSPATWAAMERAIQNEEPIVATGWKPHWKWSRFDLRYLDGAQTGQSDVFGSPEQIAIVADTSFANRYAGKVVQFFENVNVEDAALNDLMDPFQPSSDVSDKMAAAREWIQNHPQIVAEWLPGGNAGADTPAQSTPAE